MALWQGRSKRKRSGGRIVYHRGKRKYEIGREKRETIVGEHSTQVYRTMGNNRKIRILRAGIANVIDKTNNKCVKARILSVVENPANPHYVRRNIITKGATIDTDVGKAIVTSRPGQHGVINAILLEKK